MEEKLVDWPGQLWNDTRVKWELKLDLWFLVLLCYKIKGIARETIFEEENMNFFLLSGHSH